MGDSLPPYLAPSRKGPPMRSTRRTTGHLAKNSVVDNFNDACSLRCIFGTFLAVPALAVHTMKARGDNNNDDKDSNDSNNSNDKVWDEDEDNER